MAYPHVFAALSTCPMSYLDDNFNAAVLLGTDGQTLGATTFTPSSGNALTINGSISAELTSAPPANGSGYFFGDAKSTTQANNTLAIYRSNSGSNAGATLLVQQFSSSGPALVSFACVGGSGQVGSITTNGTTTSYNTTSDAALKTVYGPADGTVLSALPVHDCAFTSNPGARNPMLLAQELQAVCPWSVSLSADGPAMIDYSQLVATLIAYTQSLEARIAVLEGIAKVVAQAETALAAAAKAGLTIASALPVVQAAIARGKGGSVATP